MTLRSFQVILEWRRYARIVVARVEIRVESQRRSLFLMMRFARIV